MTRSSPHARALVVATLALAGALGSGGTTRAQAPSAAERGAFLEVGSGKAHVGAVAMIEVSDDGALVATKGADETVKLWNAATGRLLRVLRPNRVGGAVRSFDAIAFVPGTQQLVVAVFGGADAETRVPFSHLLVVDPLERDTRTWISREEGRFASLAFATDGKTLYACNSVKAVIAYDWEGKSVVARDGNPAKDCTRTSVAPDGKVAALVGGTLRIYDRTLRQLAQVPAPGTAPLALKFSHDGRRLAVGDFGTATAYVVDSADPAKQQAFSSPEIDGNMHRVAWSLDDKSLYVAGNTHKRGGRRMLFRFPVDGGAFEARDLNELTLPEADRALPARAPSEETIALTQAKDGSLYAGMSPGRIYKVARDGTATIFAEGANVPMAFVGGKPLLVSPSGTSLSYQFRDERMEAFRFDLERSELAVGTIATDGLQPPRTTSPLLRVTVAPGRGAFTVGEATTTLPATQRYQSHALSHDDKRAVVVAGQFIYCLDPSGKILWQRRMPIVISYAVNIPRDAAVAVVASGNGITWYRLSDGQVRASLLVERSKKRWVAWTPSGHYEASVGGEYLLGWIVNGNALGKYYPIAAYRNALAHLDLVTAAIRDSASPLARPDFPTATASPSSRPVAAAEPAAAPSAAPAVPAASLEASLQRRAAPQLTVLNPGDGDGFSAETIRAVVAVETPPDAPIKSVKARVNGALVADSASRTGGAGARPAGAVHTLMVPMPRDDAEIVFVAESSNGVGTSETVSVRYTGPKEKLVPRADAPERKALYILAVGISDYQKPDLRLGFAAKDARDFVAALSAQKGKLYRDVQVKALVDRDATRASIQDGLDWIMKQVTKDDVAMVFFAGHGENDASGSYYFIPVDGDPERLRATAVPWGDIKDTAFNLPGKRLFFLDTCHAGNALGSARRGAANTNKLLNELAAAEDGAVVFMSSTGRQYSLEDPAWGNGAFTRALVDGIQGAADPDKRGWVTHKMLDSYVAERVKTLTGGKQTPVSAAQGVPDFPIVQF